MRESDKYLLIGGSGRSGTTILCKSFGEHPEVSNVPEWRFMTDPDGVVDFYTKTKYGLWSPFHYDVSVKRLGDVLRRVERRGGLSAVLGSSRFRQIIFKLFKVNLSPPYSRTNASFYSPNFSTIRKEFMGELVEFSSPGYWVGMSHFKVAELVFGSLEGNKKIETACARFLRRVADDVCESQNVKYHLEKNTWNILFFDRILEILPEAKMVHIVRDPRDVVASYGVQSWVPDDYVHSALVYRDVMDKWEDVKTRVPEKSYHTVKLEELAKDPRSIYSGICDFWGIPWNDKLLTTKLSTNSFQRWRNDIPQEIQGQVCEILKPICVRYGYQSE